MDESGVAVLAVAQAQGSPRVSPDCRSPSSPSISLSDVEDAAETTTAPLLTSSTVAPTVEGDHFEEEEGSSEEEHDRHLAYPQPGLIACFTPFLARAKKSSPRVCGRPRMEQRAASVPFASTAMRGN